MFTLFTISYCFDYSYHIKMLSRTYMEVVRSKKILRWWIPPACSAAPEQAQLWWSCSILGHQWGRRYSLADHCVRNNSKSICLQACHWLHASLLACKCWQTYKLYYHSTLRYWPCNGTGTPLHCLEHSSCSSGRLHVELWLYWNKRQGQN